MDLPIFWELEFIGERSNLSNNGERTLITLLELTRIVGRGKVTLSPCRLDICANIQNPRAVIGQLTADLRGRVKNDAKYPTPNIQAYYKVRATMKNLGVHKLDRDK